MKNNNTNSINKVCVDIDAFEDYYLDNNYNENRFDIDGSLDRIYNCYKKE